MTGGDYIKDGGDRNWSFQWSYADNVSLWVAYPMYDDVLEQNVSRTNAWGYDPLIPSTSQPNLSSAYTGDWTRGHQIPSADRLASTAVNGTTFYYTNMAPQNESLNSGGWSSLETKVRSWAAASDTLYVVTGVVISPSGSKTADKNGKAVSIPTHFYKALLRLKGGSYTASAYIFSNDGNTAFSTSNAISVKALEGLTGETFFPNLPYYVGTAKAKTIKETVTTW